MVNIEIAESTLELLKEVTALQNQFVGHETDLHCVIHIALVDEKRELEKLLNE